jgi:hypothetical protein
MEEAFGTIVWVVAVVGAIVAVFTLAGTGRHLRDIGGGGIVRDGDGAGRGGGPADEAAERDEEIRQMLDARNARRARRGEAPLDVDAQIAALDRPPPGGVDEELRAEIREHVLARNARRARAGEDPLDVDEEVERRIRDLT